MTTLMLMRHAKAEAYNSDDKSRRLVDKGHRQSARTGAFIVNWCRQNNRTLSLAAVSTATRTHETFISTQLAPERASLSDDLYLCGPETMLEVLSELLIMHNIADADVILVIAHEPVISSLAYYLAGYNLAESSALTGNVHTGTGTGTAGTSMGEASAIDGSVDSDLRDRIQHGVPTGTVCVLDLKIAHGADPVASDPLGTFRFPVGAAAEGSYLLREVFTP